MQFYQSESQEQSLKLHGKIEGAGPVDIGIDCTHILVHIDHSVFTRGTCRCALMVTIVCVHALSTISVANVHYPLHNYPSFIIKFSAIHAKSLTIHDLPWGTFFSFVRCQHACENCFKVNVHNGAQTRKQESFELTGLYTPIVISGVPIKVGAKSAANHTHLHARACL